MSESLAAGDSITSPQIKTRSGHVAGISDAADSHAAAKRPRQKTPPPQLRSNQGNDPQQGFGPSDRGILTFVSHVQGPYAAHEHIFRQIALSEIDHVASAVRNQILADLYPDGNFVEANVITEDNFLLCCQYMLKARVDHVYSSYSGRRPTDRVPLPSGILLPKSIADCIAQYGTKIVHSGSLCVVPQPPNAVQDAAERIGTRVTFVILQSFTKLITLAHQRGYIKLSQLPRVLEGTAAWLLTARDANDRSVTAGGETRSIQVWSQFSEFTPADAVYAAMLANGFSGVIFTGHNDLYFNLDAITNADAARRQFATLA